MRDFSPPTATCAHEGVSRLTSQATAAVEVTGEGGGETVKGESRAGMEGGGDRAGGLMGVLIVCGQRRGESVI